ncbi:HAD family hydrolase [Taibaiella lutea]|uniref:D,D-heptose 1,7-bisphosphate phosphatase n=1 Tax=Taibaiella lutea TaxID=2608001 RepID=A0A5M6CP46_9BACT|nr:HAD family hydrolase [Taibaiella lutea]KAA5536753.1 HAD family hydrolase [Taibaiella lutea]
MATALFLDRDGVINEEKHGSYIFHKDEFIFYPGAEAALIKLSKQFDYVFIVTNQRGIGRGYMTEAALHEIHEHLISTVVNGGGKIDKVYFAPSVDSNHSHRKPNTGMALDALNDFPDIEFNKSIMVGNNLSDMKFGKTMGMKTIFLSTTQPAFSLPHELIDKQYDSLKSFSDNFR